MSEQSTQKVSRRSVIKTVGIGAGSLATFGDVRGEPITEVVIARQGDDPVLTEKVPENWHHRFKQANRVKKEIRAQTQNTAGTTMTAVMADGPQMGNRKGHTVHITFETKEEMESFGAPEQKRNINIRANYGLDVDFRKCYNKDYPDVKGAAILDPPNAPPSDNWWSAGCRVYDGSDPMLLTCYHSFGDPCDPTDVRGDSVDQNNDYFGTVKRYSANHDSVIIERDPDGQRSGISDNIVTRNYPVNAYYTSSGISNAGSLDKYGVTTCYDSASIQGQNATLDCNNGNTIDDLILTDDVTAGGDSGGPLVGLEYFSGTFYDVMGGILTGAVTVDGVTYNIWPACHKIRTDLSVSFGAFSV